MLVRGQAATAESTRSHALAVIVVKQADVAAKQQHDRDDWQKRGVDGIVTKVDAATGTITISRLAGSGRAKYRRPHRQGYDPAALPSGLGEVRGRETCACRSIKVGDQFRARGTRNPDGSDLSAEEVVSGTFRISRERSRRSTRRQHRDGAGCDCKMWWW